MNRKNRKIILSVVRFEFAEILFTRCFIESKGDQLHLKTRKEKELVKCIDFVNDKAM